MTEVELLQERLAEVERRGHRWRSITLVALLGAATSLTLQLRSRSTGQPQDHLVFENAASSVVIDASGIRVESRGNTPARKLALKPGWLGIGGAHAEVRLDGPGADVVVDGTDAAVTVQSHGERTDLGPGALSVQMAGADYEVAKNGFRLDPKTGKGGIRGSTNEEGTLLDVEADGGPQGAVGALLSAWHTGEASLIVTSSDQAAPHANSSVLFVNRRGATVEVSADGAGKSFAAGAPGSPPRDPTPHTL